MKYYFYYFLFAICFSPQLLSSQTPFPNLPPVFKDNVTPRVDILLSPDSLAVMLAPGNEFSDYHWHAVFIFNNGEIIDTVENVGFRLRGNTSRLSDKKSYKISFNTYEQGRKWQGLEKLNINGEHNDPSIARSKISWDLLRSMGIPAPRCSHVELFVNGNYFGVYANVEHVDEEFVQLRFGNKNGNLYKCLWPADLTYKGTNPNAYKFESGGRRAYDLLTNKDLDSYTDFAGFIDVLNNTPISDLSCELEQIFNVDGYLKTIAFDILTANWDGPIYNKNNFYLYHNQATGLFEYIPFDVDNTFGIDWFGVDWSTRNIYAWQHPDEPRPIYERIMAVPHYKDRFSFYMQQYLDSIYSEENLFPYLDGIKNLISSIVENDPYYPLDYGFDFQDFNASYESSLPFFHTPIGLKTFITNRINSALQQLELNDISPIISDIKNNQPSALQDINITAKIMDDGDISFAELCWKTAGQTLSCALMYDDGLHGDGAADDGLYGVVLPPLNHSGTIEYYVRTADNANHVSRQPVCVFKKISIGNATATLVINELMADNINVFADNAGEYDDWLEILNTGDVPEYLGGRYLSDNEAVPNKWPLPDFWIQPGQYLIFWADEDEGQGGFHTNFKLGAGGEFVGIFDNIGNGFALIDGIQFPGQTANKSFARLPNATGPFQLAEPTPGAMNMPVNSSEKMDYQDIEWTVSPNPFSEKLTLNVSKNNKMVGRVSLTDMYGRIVFEKEIRKEGTYIFETKNLMAGVYIFTIINRENEIIGRRVVKSEK